MFSSNKKSKRLEIRTAEVNSKVEKGWKHEDYKDLVIIYDPENLILKAWRGSAANEFIYTRFRDLDRLEKKVEDIKASADIRAERKAANKGKKELTPAAKAAKAIREELKEAFPGVKFKVTSENYSGGDSVRGSWIDGPTERQVREITDKYQYGKFDGMTDMYEYTNTRSDIPQAKYISFGREYSEELVNALLNEAEEKFGHLCGPGNRHYNIEAYLKWEILKHTPVAVGAIATGIKYVQENEIDERWTVVFDMSNVKSYKAPKPKQETVEPGKIRAIEYSSKSFAVIGDTKQYKDDLKALGGRFNFRLSCGPGWIFPNSKIEEVKELLTKLSRSKEEAPEEPQPEEVEAIEDEPTQKLLPPAKEEIEEAEIIEEITEEPRKKAPWPMLEVVRDDEEETTYNVQSSSNNSQISLF